VLRTLTPFNYCVIDEVDSILIDEARTPLIISGTSDKPSDKYYKAAKIADALTKVGQRRPGGGDSMSRTSRVGLLYCCPALFLCQGPVPLCANRRAWHASTGG
jgi:hypothetical protein